MLAAKRRIEHLLAECSSMHRHMTEESQHAAEVQRRAAAEVEERRKAAMLRPGLREPSCTERKVELQPISFDELQSSSEGVDVSQIVGEALGLREPRGDSAAPAPRGFDDLYAAVTSSLWGNALAAEKGYMQMRERFAVPPRSALYRNTSAPPLFGGAVYSRYIDYLCHFA